MWYNSGRIGIETITDEKLLVAKEDSDELPKEQNNLIHVIRDGVIYELQEVRVQGDLSENTDHDAACDYQACAEARIHDLEAMTANIEIISEDKKTATKKTVSLGFTVTILDMSIGEEETYNVAGSTEANPLNGKLSNITLLTTLLMDYKIGNVIEIKTTEEPYQVKVVDLK